jgi:hypothetical protein
MKVVVVTTSELGWNCVIGVYSSEEVALKAVNEIDEGTIEELEGKCYHFGMWEVIDE